MPSAEYLREARHGAGNISYDEVWSAIHRGLMPELRRNPDFDRGMFYSAYTSTYIERDVRELSQIGDTVKFTRFMTAAAASTGRLPNLPSMARDAGVSPTAADRWLSAPVLSNIVYPLPPYLNNVTKRAVKTPKLYFPDTGLAAYLTGWTSPDTLKSGATAGPFFESFVISEIVKSYYNRGAQNPPLYFYRDRDGGEIDPVIEENGVLYPLEIKEHADPSARDLKVFDLLDKIPGENAAPAGSYAYTASPLFFAGRTE